MTENKEDGCCTKFATTTGLCCFMDEDSFTQKPLTEVVQNDKRRCTDLPCCCILLLALISEIFLISYASKNGADPELLMHGYDSRIFTTDNSSSKPLICNNNNPNGTYTIWPDLEYSNIRICEASCSNTFDVNNKLMIGIPYPSISFMNAFCLPNYNYKNISSKTLPNSFSNSNESYQRAISDLQTSCWLILIMSFIAILISYIYIKIIGCIGRMLIIFTIITVLIGGGTLCWLLITDGQTRMNNEETHDLGKYEFYSGIILSILLFFFILALWFLRKNIELIIKMMNEASYAIRDVKSTLIFPIFMTIIGICYMTFWIIEALYIYSVKILTINNYPDGSDFITNNRYPGIQYYQYEFDENMQNALKWHFIMLFYISQVIIYFGFMVLSGVFSDWYFSLWDNKNNKTKQRGNDIAQLSYYPIFESFWRVIRYHLGSLAFGALIITIIRIIRAIVTYIQKKTKSGGNNPLIKCIFCCVQCCLKCCQCIFDKINKQGFIFTTIYGTPYCYSSYTALKLLVHNIGRAVMIDAVSKYSEIFGRIVIALLNTCISIIIMKYYKYYKNNLSSYFLPAIIVFIITYIIAALFMMVFEVAIESIFLCYLVDEKVNNGDAKFSTHELTQMSSFIPKRAESDSDNTELGSYIPPYGKQKTNDHNLDYTAV